MQTQRLRPPWFRREDASAAASLFYALALGCVCCGSDNESADTDSSAPGPVTSWPNTGGASTTGNYGGAQNTDSTKSSEDSPSHSGGSQNTASGSPSGGTAGASGSSTIEHCSPLTMSGWFPPAYVPPRQAASCTATEIADYYDVCLFGSDCAAFLESGSSSPCGACLAPSGYTDASYGPLLLAQSAPSYIYLSNTSGCIDLVGEPVCGAKIQAADSCARAACATPCTVGGLLNFGAYQECMRTARTTVCAEYEKASACIVDPSHAAACRGADGGFRSLYIALAEVFCS
jgi:hypothetical protein